MPSGAKDPASPQAQAVAEQIRRELGAQRISGRQLAEKIGKSPNYVNLRIRGEKALDLNDLDAIAAALGLNVIVLLEAAERSPQATPTVVRLTDHRTSGPRTDDRPKYSNVSASREDQSDYGLAALTEHEWQRIQEEEQELP